MGVTTVQLTAKRWKLVQIFGAGIILVGASVAVIGMATRQRPLWIIGAVIVASGLGVYGAGSTAAWWHHG